MLADLLKADAKCFLFLFPVLFFLADVILGSNTDDRLQRLGDLVILYIPLAGDYRACLLYTSRCV